MSNDLKSRMIEKLTEARTALTGTALAKAVGYTKNSASTKAAIEELLGEGRIARGVNALGYNAYSIVVHTAPPVEPAVTTGTEQLDPDQPIHPDFEVPVNPRGYTIERVSGRFTYKITPPKGAAEIVLTAHERLLVINDDPNYQYVIDDAEGVLQAIGEFTAEVGYTTFIVKDMSTGKAIATKTDVTNDAVVLFLQIDRHNKAGK